MIRNNIHKSFAFYPLIDSQLLVVFFFFSPLGDLHCKTELINPCDLSDCLDAELMRFLFVKAKTSGLCRRISGAGWLVQGVR